MKDSPLSVLGILIAVVIAILIGITLVDWYRALSAWVRSLGQWNQAHREAEANGAARRAEHRDAIRGTLTVL